ncbi:MAG: cytochrome c [Planctomycetes bacterium]|nr:cytochrome c [Planctomycetota bacterium]
MTRALLVMLCLTLAGAAIGFSLAAPQPEPAGPTKLPDSEPPPAPKPYPIRLLLPEKEIDRKTSMQYGEQVFFANGCWQCHRMGNREMPGGLDEPNVGPDLSAVGKRLPPEAIYESITNPSAVIAEPAAKHAVAGMSKMPPFPELKHRELVDLTTFLSAQKEEAPAKEKGKEETQALQPK